MKRLITYLADASSPLPSPLEWDRKVVLYVALAAGFGGFAAFVSLLQKENVPLRLRTVLCYILGGVVASSVIVMLLIEKYGASYLLAGVSTLAGYKALDILSNLGVGLIALIRRAFKDKEEGK